MRTMSIMVRINCDKGNAYGTCSSSSWPESTVEEALAVAESQGWYIKTDRHLCPGCAGHKR